MYFLFYLAISYVLKSLFFYQSSQGLQSYLYCKWMWFPFNVVRFFPYLTPAEGTWPQSTLHPLCWSGLSLFWRRGFSWWWNSQLHSLPRHCLGSVWERWSHNKTLYWSLLLDKPFWDGGKSDTTKSLPDWLMGLVIYQLHLQIKNKKIKTGYIYKLSRWNHQYGLDIVKKESMKNPTAVYYCN